MKSRLRTTACVLAAAMLLALAGCQLARSDMGAEALEDGLVGVLITTEHLDLFDYESYIEDHVSQWGGSIVVDGDDGAYQGRLYAALVKETLTDGETGQPVEHRKYAFEGVDGMAYFTALVPAAAEHEKYHATMADDGISDCQTKLSGGGLENSISLEGTVYVSPLAGMSTYYINPVYQSADGRVYLTAGSGFSTEGGQSEGAAFSQTMTASWTRTENGKTVKDSTSVKITIEVMDPPESIAVLQMDGASRVVSRREYAPGSLPQEITPEENAVYFIVETVKTDGGGNVQTARTLYGRDAGFLETFFRREDGVCVKQRTGIRWGG